MKQVPSEINGVRVVKISDAYAPLINPRAKGDRKLANAVTLTLAGGSEVLFCRMCGQFYADDDLKKSARSMVSHLSHHKRNGDTIVTEFPEADEDLESIVGSIANVADMLVGASRSATELARNLFSASERLAELLDILEDRNFADPATIDKAARFDKMKDLLG